MTYGENMMNMGSGGLNAGTVYCRVAVDASGAVRSLTGFNAALKTLAQQSEEQLGRVKRGMDNVALGMTAIATAGIGAVVHVTQVAGAFEQLNISMKTLLGSKDKATAFLNDLRQFEPHTPYSMESLANFSKMLMAAGMATKEIIPGLKAIGDMSSALGASEERIGMFMRSFQELRSGISPAIAFRNMQRDMPGLNPFKIVAESMGKSVEEIHELSRKGALDGTKVADALLKGMEKVYGGAMQQQMESLNGQLTNLKTKVWNAEIALGNGLLPTIKSGAAFLATMTDKFNALTDSQKQFASSLMIGIPVTALVIAGVATLANTLFGLRANIQAVVLAHQMENDARAQATAGVAEYAAELQQVSVQEMTEAQAAMDAALSRQEGIQATLASADALLAESVARRQATQATYEQTIATSQANIATLKALGTNEAFIASLVAENNARRAEAYAAYEEAIAEEAETRASIDAARANEAVVASEIEKAAAMARSAAVSSEEAVAITAGVNAQRVAFLGLTPAMWAFVGVAAAVSIAAWGIHEALTATERQHQNEVAATGSAVKALEAEKEVRKQLAENLKAQAARYEELKYAVDRAMLAHKDAAVPQEALKRIQHDMAENIKFANSQLGIQVGQIDDVGKAALTAAEKLLKMDGVERQIAKLNALQSLQKSGVEAEQAMITRLTDPTPGAFNYLGSKTLTDAIARWNKEHPTDKVDLSHMGNAYMPEDIMGQVRKQLTSEKIGEFTGSLYPIVKDMKASQAYQQSPAYIKQKLDELLILTGKANAAAMQLQLADQKATDTTPPPGGKSELDQAKITALRLKGKAGYLEALQRLQSLQQSEVDELIKADAGAKQIEAALKQKNATDAEIAKLQKTADKEAKKAATAEPDIATKYKSQLTVIDQQAEVAATLGHSYDTVAEKAKAARSAIDAYFTAGVAPTDSRVKAMVKDLQSYLPAVAAEEITAKANGVLTTLRDGLAGVEAEEKALGVSSATHSKRMDLLRTAYVDLIPYADKYGEGVYSLSNAYHEAEQSLADYQTREDAVKKSTELTADADKVLAERINAKADAVQGLISSLQTQEVAMTRLANPTAEEAAQTDALRVKLVALQEQFSLLQQIEAPALLRASREHADRMDAVSRQIMETLPGGGLVLANEALAVREKELDAFRVSLRVAEQQGASEETRARLMGNVLQLEEEIASAKGAVYEQQRRLTDEERKTADEVTRRRQEEQATLASLRDQVAQETQRTRDILTGNADLTPEQRIALLQQRRDQQASAAADIEAYLTRAHEGGLRSAPSDAEMAEKELALAKAQSAIADLDGQMARLLHEEHQAQQTMLDTFGAALWDYHRDKRAITSYFQQAAQDAGKAAFATLWDTLTKSKTDSDGKALPGSSPLAAMAAQIAGSGVGKAIGLDRLLAFGKTDAGKKLATGALAAYGAYSSIANSGETDRSSGAMSGAVGGASAGFALAEGLKMSGPLGGVLGALVGGIFGGNAAAKRAADDAQRMREQMLQELRKMNNALTPVSDYFRGMSLNMLPSGLTFGGLANGYAATTSRGTW